MSASMAKRTPNQYRGNRGEMEVVLDLLDIGAGVNDLTSTDNGWDLHVQLPLRPVDATSASSSWEMSGRDCKVQVKKLAGRNRPKLKVGQVHAWVDGHTPTFLVLVRDDGVKEYASPRCLAKWLRQIGSVPHASQVAASALETRSSMSAPAVGRFLHFWTGFPSLMVATSRLEDWAVAGSAREEEVRDFVIDLVKGWAERFNQQDGYDYQPWFASVETLANSAARTAKLSDEVAARFQEQALTEYTMSTNPLAPQLYSRSVDQEDVLADAQRLLEELLPLIEVTVTDEV